MIDPEDPSYFILHKNVSDPLVRKYQLAELFTDELESKPEIDFTDVESGRRTSVLLLVSCDSLSLHSLRR